LAAHVFSIYHGDFSEILQWYFILYPLWPLLFAVLVTSVLVSVVEWVMDLKNAVSMAVSWRYGDGIKIDGTA